MTKISEILTRLLPDAYDAPLVQIKGAKNDAQTLADTLTDFSSGTNRYLICCLPIFWLASNTPRPRALRERLLSVENNWLDVSAILPSGAIDGTSATYGLLLLDKQRKAQNQSTIRFVDARNEDWTESSADFRDVLLKKTPLIASYYCLDALTEAIEAIRTKGRPLSSVADIIVAPQSAAEGEKYRCLSVREFSRFGYTVPPDACEKKYYSKLDSGLFLRQNDILVVIQGATGKTAIVSPSESCVPAYMTCIIRTHAEDPRVLYLYFQSELIQSYISRCVSGMSISRLSLSDLKQLPIPLFTEKQTGEMIALFAELDGLRVKIKSAIRQGDHLLKKFFSLE